MDCEIWEIEKRIQVRKTGNAKMASDVFVLDWLNVETCGRAHSFFDDIFMNTNLIDVKSKLS